MYISWFEIKLQKIDGILLCVHIYIDVHTYMSNFIDIFQLKEVLLGPFVKMVILW
jgi:hypothetical protein